jgi:hypothetical protein
VHRESSFYEHEEATGGNKMKQKKLVTVFCGALVILFLTFFYGFAQTVQIIDPLSKTLTYQRFLVADLGLEGRGKQNRIFRVEFAGASAALYHLNIEVIRQKDGKRLASGNTDPQVFNTMVSGGPYWNYEIDGALGGDFTVSDDAKDLEKKILATGAFPEGTFIIRLTLVQEPAAPVSTDQMTVTINHPYLDHIFPKDTMVSKSLLNFRWRTNFSDLEFRLYRDPRGKQEIIAGSRLPRRNVSQQLDGSNLANLLTYNNYYYWQINGKINTSHGLEFIRGPISEFLFVEDGTPLEDLGLSEAEKRAIYKELEIILRELLGRKGVRSIMGYELLRAVLDGNYVTWNEIMAILALIKSGEVEMNAIYFQ